MHFLVILTKNQKLRVIKKKSRVVSNYRKYYAEKEYDIYFFKSKKIPNSGRKTESCCSIKKKTHFYKTSLIKQNI